MLPTTLAILMLFSLMMNTTKLKASLPVMWSMTEITNLNQRVLSLLDCERKEAKCYQSHQ